MLFQENYNLLQHNTLGLDVRARYFLVAQDKFQLIEALALASKKNLTVLVLGAGSNIVFTGDFDGLVLIPNIRGVEVKGHQVVIGAGENWHQLVRNTLDQGLSGLENLSMIPGLVGAAPIQNIGAYGQELANVFVQLEALDIGSGEEMTFDGSSCEFGYRDSIFKNQLRGAVVITGITLALATEFVPILAYKDLGEELDSRKISEPTAVEVSDAVMSIRRRKLPDPALTGNVGSFFKNPVVTQEQLTSIEARHSKVPLRQQDDIHYKIPAAWLIEQAGMKGASVGDAMVSEQHSLVIVNLGNAGPADITRLREEIQHRVHDQFGLHLEMEPVLC